MARTLSERKRTDLVDAAIEVFKEKGPRDTTVRDMVNRAGASSATFYRYFKNKEDIYGSIVTDFFADFTRAWGRIVDLFSEEGIGQEQALEAVSTALRTVFEFYLEHKEVAGVIFRRVVPIDDSFVERGQEMLDMFLDQMDKVFTTLGSAGLGRDLDPRLGAAVTVGAVFGAAVEYVIERKEVDIDKMVHQFMTVVRHGIVPEGKYPAP